MSIWTSRGAALAILTLTMLPGCEGGPGATRDAPTAFPVAGGAVVIAGPPGYCIDTGGSRDSGGSAFVLLGSCASVANDPEAPIPPVPGILTASVEDGAGDVDAFLRSLDQTEAFIRSAPGRAALARDGSAASVQVLESQRQDQALYLRISDTSKGMQGVAPEYWRGLFDLNGRLVTASAMSFADRPMSSGHALDTLRAFVIQIRAETPTLAELAAAPPEPERGLFGALID